MNQRVMTEVLQELKWMQAEAALILRRAFGEISTDIPWGVQFLPDEDLTPWRVEVGDDSEQVERYWGSDPAMAIETLEKRVKFVVDKRKAS